MSPKQAFSASVKQSQPPLPTSTPPTPPPPSLPPPQRSHSMTSAAPVKAMPTGQLHENDRAATVIVCAPSTLSKMMGSLHPAGALYEKPVNTQLALAAHNNFVDILKKHGAQVLDVRDILIDRVAWSVGDRIELENLAFKSLAYLFDRQLAGRSAGDKDGVAVDKNGGERLPGGSDSDGSNGTFTDAEEYYISDKYKRSVIEKMDEQQLVDIILTHPTVTVSPSTRDTGFTARYTFDPLTNVVFVRDQQITTKRGIVMARLQSSQRAREVDVLEFCLNKIGLHVVGRIPAPGHLEGGDFFPLGPGMALLGVGSRSDWAAAQHLLSHDLVGTSAVAVVRDEFEKRQERMHLDTVFNVISHDCCIMLDEIMGEESKTRRMVDEYVLASEDRDGQQTGEREERIGPYVLQRKGVEFSRYMREHGFNIIEVTGEEQLNYGCNVLNLGNDHIVSIERKVARRIACSPFFRGTVQFLDFRGVTCMYGGVHCASQVVRREYLDKDGDDDAVRLLKDQGNL